MYWFRIINHVHSNPLKHKHIRRHTHYKQTSIMTQIYVHAQKHIYTDICKDMHMYTDTQRYIHTLLVLFSWRTVICIISVIVEKWPIWWVMEVQVMKRLYLLEGGFREEGGSASIMTFSHGCPTPTQMNHVANNYYLYFVTSGRSIYLHQSCRFLNTSLEYLLHYSPVYR